MWKLSWNFCTRCNRKFSNGVWKYLASIVFFFFHSSLSNSRSSYVWAVWGTAVQDRPQHFLADVFEEICFQKTNFVFFGGRVNICCFCKKLQKSKVDIRGNRFQSPPPFPITPPLIFREAKKTFRGASMWDLFFSIGNFELPPNHPPLLFWQKFRKGGGDWKRFPLIFQHIRTNIEGRATKLPSGAERRKIFTTKLKNTKLRHWVETWSTVLKTWRPQVSSLDWN